MKQSSNYNCFLEEQKSASIKVPIQFSFYCNRRRKVLQGTIVHNQWSITSTCSDDFLNFSDFDKLLMKLLSNVFNKLTAVLPCI